MGLITLATAKTHLGVSGSGDDATITAFIAAATEAMEGGAQRHLESTSVTEYLDGNGSRRLWLKESAESITSVHVDSARAWGVASLETAADYRVDGCVLDHLDEIWPIGRSNVRVIYSAGYATVPDDLAQACKAQVSMIYSEWQRAKTGLTNLSSQSVEGWAQQFIGRTGLDPSVAEVIRRYVPARL